MGQCDLHIFLVHPSAKFIATVPYFLNLSWSLIYSSYAVYQFFCGCTENAEILHVGELLSH